MVRAAMVTEPAAKTGSRPAPRPLDAESLLRLYDDLGGRRAVVGEQAAVAGDDAHARGLGAQHLELDLDLAPAQARGDDLAVFDLLHFIGDDAHALQRSDGRSL